MEQITDNVEVVRQKVADAAIKSGRNAEAITLVAVSKYVPAETSRLLFNAGCHDLGESRPQQLWEKASELRDLKGPLRWHMIGHLQRNKVARTLPLVHLIHSIDSIRLWKAIAKEATKQELTVNALIEVNVSGDESKHGFAPDELEAALDENLELQGVQIQGFMAMASRTGGTAAAANDFERMRVIQQTMIERFGDAAGLDELSMGMSGDFEQAIEHGATLVRVGSALIR